MNRNDIPCIKNAGVGHYILPMLMLGSAFFTATDAHAAKIAEVQKYELEDQAGYVVDVIDEHLKLIAMKNLDLFKKTEIAMYTPSSGPGAIKGVSQGVVDIMGAFKIFREKGYADKMDVELVCRLVLEQVWKENGWTHEGKIAHAGMFFPKGFQVTFTPPKSDDDNSTPLTPPATQSNKAAKK